MKHDDTLHTMSISKHRIKSELQPLLVHFFLFWTQIGKAIFNKLNWQPSLALEWIESFWKVNVDVWWKLYKKQFYYTTKLELKHYLPIKPYFFPKFFKARHQPWLRPEQPELRRPDDRQEQGPDRRHQQGHLQQRRLQRSQLGNLGKAEKFFNTLLVSQKLKKCF